MAKRRKFIYRTPRSVFEERLGFDFLFAKLKAEHARKDCDKDSLDIWENYYMFGLVKLNSMSENMEQPVKELQRRKSYFDHKCPLTVVCDSINEKTSYCVSRLYSKLYSEGNDVNKSLTDELNGAFGDDYETANKLIEYIGDCGNLQQIEERINMEGGSKSLYMNGMTSEKMEFYRKLVPHFSTLGQWEMMNYSKKLNLNWGDKRPESDL